MDLKTTYMGMNLKNPIVPSSSPLTDNLDDIRRLEDAGSSAVVLRSLFEEQITQEGQQLHHYLSYGADSFGEALSYFPEMETYGTGPDEYLKLVQQAKESTDIPVIGSLNGVTVGGWKDYAKKIAEAGADALELNVYYLPTDFGLSGGDVEQIYLDILRDVRGSVSIPVAMKLCPYFSALANMTRRLAESGADALVLFNRFYQPDFDLDNLEVVPSLSLSKSNELRMPLRWVAILYGRVDVDFAITTGIHTHMDVLKSMMAGAKVAMMASELLRNGTSRVREILEAMTFWMEEHEYESVQQMQGSMSQQNVKEPAAFERANYMKVLASWRPDPSGQLPS
jgi:dihydroorotate dehydrogenase (fumarate)